MSSGAISTDCGFGCDECLLCEAMAFMSGFPTGEPCKPASQLTRATFAAGQPLALQGVAQDRLYFLTDGLVKAGTSLPDGRQQILCARGPGDLVGLESLVSGLAPATFTPLTTVQACSLNLRDIREVLRKDTGTAHRALHLVLRELQRSWNRIQDLGLLGARERIASVLLDLPRSRDNPDEVLLPFTREELSEMTGLTLETVSRHMAWLKRSGIIQEQKGRIRLMDRASLSELAAEPVESVV